MSEQEKDQKSPKFWFELKIGDEKVSLNYRGTTESGSARYVSEGEAPYAFYVGPQAKSTSLYRLKPEGNEEVCRLYIREGNKEGKDFFFLSNAESHATLNLHGNKEVVEQRKDDLRAMEANAKAAAAARQEEKQGDKPAAPSRPRP